MDSNIDTECLNIINEKDLYKVLGINKESGEDEIRKAYKKSAMKFHPDKNQSQHSADAFKRVSHAFTILSNKEKKLKYDTFGTDNDEEIHMHNHRGGFNDEVDPFVKIY
jgi:molecular chaperone DnaJ